MGNISKFIQLFVCSLRALNRVLEVHTHTNKIKKNHTQAKRAPRIKKTEKLKKKSSRSMNPRSLQPCLFRFFPAFRVHRSPQRIGKEEHGQPMETVNLASLQSHCCDKPALRAPLEVLHLVFTQLHPSLDRSGALV